MENVSYQQKTIELKPGDYLTSVNYRLVTLITYLDEFWDVINKDITICVRNRLYFSEFYIWNLSQIKMNIDEGVIWRVERVKK